MLRCLRRRPGASPVCQQRQRRAWLPAELPLAFRGVHEPRPTHQPAPVYGAAPHRRRGPRRRSRAARRAPRERLARHLADVRQEADAVGRARQLKELLARIQRDGSGSGGGGSAGRARLFGGGRRCGWGDGGPGQLSAGAEAFCSGAAEVAVANLDERRSGWRRRRGRCCASRSTPDVGAARAARDAARGHPRPAAGAPPARGRGACRAAGRTDGTGRPERRPVGPLDLDTQARLAAARTAETPASPPMGSSTRHWSMASRVGSRTHRRRKQGGRCRTAATARRSCSGCCCVAHRSRARVPTARPTRTTRTNSNEEEIGTACCACGRWT